MMQLELNDHIWHPENILFYQGNVLAHKVVKTRIKLTQSMNRYRNPPVFSKFGPLRLLSVSKLQ